MMMLLTHSVILVALMHLQKAYSFVPYVSPNHLIKQKLFKHGNVRNSSKGDLLHNILKSLDLSKSFSTQASILTLLFALGMAEPTLALTKDSSSIFTSNRIGNNEYNIDSVQTVAINKDSLNNPYSFGIDSQGSFNICPGSSYSLVANNCVSSQDDRPQYFLEPVSYDGSWITTKNKLLQCLLSIPGTTILGDSNEGGSKESAYVHVKFAISGGNEGAYDESEFYFPPNDNIMHFRSLRQRPSVSSAGLSDEDTNPYSYIISSKSGFQSIDVSQSNRKRMEMIIKKLNLEYIPILRNRKSLFGIETPFDSFGPPTVIFDHNVDEDAVLNKQSVLYGLTVDDLVGLE